MTRRRVQLLGALLVSAFLPYFIRLMLTPGSAGDPPALNTFGGNAVAVFIAFWVRLSVEPFPGVRSSSLNLPVASASHAVVVVGIVLLRLPYDRSFLLAGYVIHLLWLYAIYFFAQRRESQSNLVAVGGLASLVAAISARLVRRCWCAIIVKWRVGR